MCGSPRPWLVLFVVGIAVGAAGCDVSLDVEGSRFACASDDDCASGYACQEVAGLRQCVATGSNADVDVVDVADTSEDDANDTTATTTNDTAGPDVDTGTDTRTDDTRDPTTDTCAPGGCPEGATIYVLVDLDNHDPSGSSLVLEFRALDDTLHGSITAPVTDRSEPALYGPVAVPSGVPLEVDIEDSPDDELGVLAQGELLLLIYHDELDDLELASVSSVEFEQRQARLAVFETMTSVGQVSLRVDGQYAGPLSEEEALWRDSLGASTERHVELRVGGDGHGEFRFPASQSPRQVWVTSGDGWGERLLVVDLASETAELTVHTTTTCRAFEDEDCVDGQWCHPTDRYSALEIVGECITPGARAAGEPCADDTLCAADHVCVDGACLEICHVDVAPVCASGASCVEDGGELDLYDVCSGSVCSPSAQTGCTQGERCVLNGEGNGLTTMCTDLIGSRMPGDLCDPSDESGMCGVGAQCLPDFVAGGTSGDARCYAFCDDRQPASCGTDGPCVSFSSMGASGLAPHEGFCIDD